MNVVYEEYPEYTVVVKENGEIEYLRVDSVDGDYSRVTHECGFETEVWVAENFLVFVDLEEKTIKPIGKYWKEFEKDFKEIAKKIGFGVINRR